MVSLSLSAQRKANVYINLNTQSEGCGLDTCAIKSLSLNYSVFTVGHKDYIVPVVSVEANKDVVVDFSLFNLSNQQIVGGKYSLACGETEASFVSNNNNVVSFKINGTQSTSERYYNLMRPGNHGNDTLTCLKVMTFKPQTEKLVLVPVNGATVSNEYVTALQADLNKVFSPVVISWEVTVAVPYTVEGWDAENDGIALIMDQNTKEMKSIVSAFKKEIKPERKVNYLFVMPKVNTEMTTYWLRGSSFGFTSPGANSRMIMYEIGRGIFKLDDLSAVLPAGTQTNNLMDIKGTGTSLIMPQWNEIR